MEKSFVNIQMDENLLAELDKMAKQDLVNRSVFIRRLIAQESTRRYEAGKLELPVKKEPEQS